VNLSEMIHYVIVTPQGICIIHLYVSPVQSDSDAIARLNGYAKPARLAVI